MKKLYYYPPANGPMGYGNPYSINYKSAMSEFFSVMEADNKPQHYCILGAYIFKRAFQADIYVFNWIENIGVYRMPIIQCILIILALCIIKIRRRKIIWMFHNIHPHTGISLYSRLIQGLLYKFSNLIISHSQEATNYLREKGIKAEFISHPIKCFDFEQLKFGEKIYPCDVLIWGTIAKYKGIKEFISIPEIQSSTLKIRIIGTGKDKKLLEEIASYCTNNIVLEEKRASYGEIAAYCKTAKYVLFPYVGDCVSSSGALIDTLAMGGTPIGPNKGAFRDLAHDHLCVTYNNKKELMEILNSQVTKIETKKFLKENSWSNFAHFVNEKIIKNG